MKIVRKFIFFLLVAAINITLSAYLLSATLLNAHYWQTKAQTSHLYNSLSRSLPATLVPSSGPESQVAQQNLTALMSNNYLETKISPFVGQLQAYYQGTGQTPQLDLTDLAEEAQRLGVQIPENSLITRPLTPDTPKGIKTVFNWIKQIKLVGPIVVLVLAAILVLLYKGWHRFAAVAKVLVVSAASEGLLFLVFKFTPGLLLDSLIKSNANSGPLSEIIVSFSKSLLIDASSIFGAASVGLGVAGVVVFIAGLIYRAMGFVGRHSGGEKSGGRYKRPETETRPPL